MNRQWEIEIENCSNHPQLTILKHQISPTFVNAPVINPFKFDIPSQSTKSSILKLIVDSNHITTK